MSGARRNPITAATRPGSSMSSAAWRAGRHGGGLAAGLLRAVPPATRSAWPRAHRPATRCWCRAATPSACRSSQLLRAAADGATHRGMVRDEGCEDRRLDLADLRAQALAAHRRRLLRDPVLSRRDRSQTARDRRARPASGAQLIVGVDPISLGVLAPPGDYGADIVVGTTQPLGVHMNCGGGVGGFIASRDEERYAREYQRLPGLASPTPRVPANIGFGLASSHQTSYGMRERGQGLDRQLGLSLGHRRTPSTWRCSGRRASRGRRADPARSALRGAAARRHRRRAHALRRRLLQGVRRRLHRHRQDRRRDQPALREHGIFGGKDLSAEFPELGQIALYCVTEIHTAGRHRPAGRRARQEVLCMSDDPKLPRLSRRPSGTSRSSWRWAQPGRRGAVLPRARAGGADRRLGASDAGARGHAPQRPPALPELTEPEVLRHYLQLSQQTLGMMGVSLFGTCTMKYNAPVNEEAARRTCAEVHPLQPEDTLQGIARDRPRLRPDPARAVRHGPVRVPGRRRRRCGLHPCVVTRAYLAGARRAGAAQRDHHDDPDASLQCRPPPRPPASR